ncbi:MAG: helix-turn-helix transcriptional regulator, partial [Jiangellaceae bacterium]
TGISAAPLTDQTRPIRDVFGTAGDALLAAANDHHRRAIAETFLRDRLPPPDSDYDLVTGIVATMLAERSITRVDQVSARFGLSTRSLQRLFHRFVGVGPKWVIRRYRLHDGAALLASGTITDISTMAVQLGYFDQAHFTRDFSDLVGSSPAEYARACAASGDPEPMALLT